MLDQDDDDAAHLAGDPVLIEAEGALLLCTLRPGGAGSGGVSRKPLKVRGK